MVNFPELDFIAACIIPTGIGCSTGGFAGDASPYVNLLSKVCPIITNPNAVNAAVFSGINSNILYTEGFAIDMLFREEIALRPSKFNKIGVVFDSAIPEKVLNVNINTINAVKSTYGINIIGYEITKEPVGIQFTTSESGISSGKVKNPKTLINSTKKLLSKGAEAIASVCFFPQGSEFEEKEYSKGIGVDPVGGVESLISHILTRELRVPSAHAPAFGEDSLIIPHEIVNPKTAAEYITPTFLPSILLGLYNAPKIIDMFEYHPNDIKLNRIKALLTPYSCLGGLPVLIAAEKNIPIIAVESNKTVLNLPPESMGIVDKVIVAKNYQEAAGILLSMKHGIFM